MVATVASTVVCVIAIIGVWSNCIKDPIRLDTDIKSSIDSIAPFPAITICNFNGFATKKFNYTAAYRSLLKFDGNDSRDLTAAEYVKFYSCL